MAGNPFPLSKEQLLQAYRTMRTIREFEERLHIDFGRGDIPGFVHLYAGEEAAGDAIAICIVLDDYGLHRGINEAAYRRMLAMQLMDQRWLYTRLAGKLGELTPDQAAAEHAKFVNHLRERAVIEVVQ